jgi:hypothetical protein
LKEERERCLAAGCTGHMTKPISWPDLISTISEVTARPDCQRGRIADSKPQMSIVRAETK